MDLEVILSILGTGLGIFITILTFIIKMTKNTKIRKHAERLLALTNQLSVFVEEAESFRNYTGEEKKNYVLTKMNRYSLDNKLEYDEEYISKKLEELIETTKKVNTEKKDQASIAEEDWLK